MKVSKSSLVISFCFLVAGLLAGILLTAILDVSPLLPGGERSASTERPARFAPSSSAQTQRPVSRPSFVKAAKVILPSIVSIASTKIFTAERLKEMHGQNGSRGPEDRSKYNLDFRREYRQRGSGSGVIISSDGYIVTNVHVVVSARTIFVTLTDNRSFRARVIGLDKLSEVAVIKIDARNLPYARLGDSDSCRVGEWVLAVGNPLDLRSTVTAGIISAKNRQIDIIHDNYSVESFIQTDAAINPGNSGGALVNLHGEVIGINTAIATETGYDMGFGFAIPINLVKKVSADLIRSGHVRRAYLGIALKDINEIEARALHLERPQGVFVDDVFPDGPAFRAGILPMDIILSINGRAVNRTNELQAIVARLKPHARVKIVLLRDGEKKTMALKLGLKVSTNPLQSQPSPTHSFANFGLSAENLTDFDRVELGYNKEGGVLITNVARESPAEKCGLQVDDILVAINRKRIANKSAFITALASLKRGQVAIFRVRRAAATFHHFLEVPKQ